MWVAQKLGFTRASLVAVAAVGFGGFGCHHSSSISGSHPDASTLDRADGGARATGDGGNVLPKGDGGSPSTTDGGGSALGDAGLSSNADAGGSSGDLAPAEPADFIAALHSALCQRAVECGELGDISLCELFLQSEGGMDFGRREALEDALLNGRQTYDRAIAQQCLDALVTRPCGSESVHDLDAYPACVAAFTGTVGVAGTCEAWGDCAPGLGCAKQGECSGDCQAIPSNVCLRASDCPANDLCKLNACVARTPPGATNGSPCSDYGLCGDGLTCVDSKCIPVSDAGGSCASDDGCTTGHRCVNGTCERIRQPGDNCNLLSVEAAFCGAAVGLVACDTSVDKCAIIPSSGHCLAQGQCNPMMTYCDYNTWTCLPREAAGDPCTTDAQCATAPRSTALCDGANTGSGICKVVPDPICGF